MKGSLVCSKRNCTVDNVSSSSASLCLFSTVCALCNCFKPNLIWDNQQTDEHGLSLSSPPLFYVVKANAPCSHSQQNQFSKKQVKSWQDWSLALSLCYQVHSLTTDFFSKAAVMEKACFSSLFPWNLFGFWFTHLFSVKVCKNNKAAHSALYSALPNSLSAKIPSECT